MAVKSTTEVPWRRLIHRLDALIAYAKFGVLRLLPFRAAQFFRQSALPIL